VAGPAALSHKSLHYWDLAWAGFHSPAAASCRILPLTRLNATSYASPRPFIPLHRTIDMLDRISPDPTLESRPSRKVSNYPLQAGHQSRDKLRVLTLRFRNALKKGVEGIIEAGRVLIQAKNELEHGQFTDWVVGELRFGSRKEGSREADLRKADMLMFLARDSVVSNPCHWHDFPTSPRTLWELTQIRPKQRLLDLIATGAVNSGMTREEAVALRHKTSQGRSPTPKLKREIAALLNACILLGGGDVVLAHIRDLKEVSEIPPNAEVDRAARWVKRKLTERRRAD
jgi:hypothetical protein